MKVDTIRFTSTNLPLRSLITGAYGVPAWSVIGGPAWIDNVAYDVAATYPPDTPRENIRPMLQALLSERFSLKVHREMKEHPVYALKVAKGGLKLNPGAPGKFSVRYGKEHLELTSVSMPALVDYLAIAHAADRPVLDMTGLKGLFDITLDWRSTGAQTDLNESSASIFTALEQVGLKLEPLKAPYQFIVVDSAEKPSEN